MRQLLTQHSSCSRVGPSVDSKISDITYSQLFVDNENIRITNDDMASIELEMCDYLYINIPIYQIYHNIWRERRYTFLLLF